MYPTLFTTPGVKQFAEEIDAERQRQITKFGDQHHPDGTGDRRWADAANVVRGEVDDAARAGLTTWNGILREELFEVLAEEDPVRLHTELVQVAAVCAAWIADIDSRTPAETPAACGKCRTPFDDTDARFDGRARHNLTPYCRRCVDRCHDNESADHRCVICA